MPSGTFADHPGWIPTPVFWSSALHARPPDVEWYTYLTHSELLGKKNWFNIGFHKRTLFRGNITLPNKTSIHSSVLKRTRQLLQMPSFSKCQPETQSTLKSFTRAMHHLFRGQTTSSRTWTPSAHSLSLEVASDHHQEQLHCRSLTLTPCQSLWRGRRGHDVRAFGRRMRAELPLQTIKHSITLTFSSMHCAKLW
jgi:hypothetical protein